MEGSVQSPSAVLFDFDGTISTLRHGWEQVMRPLMLEMIDPEHPEDLELQREVDKYIDQSTGIQTIYQMEWLEQQVRQREKNPIVQDKWWYKQEYNRRLMAQVEQRIQQVESGAVPREQFLIRGSAALLQALKERNVALYVASGTDHEDVTREASVLGLKEFFTRIQGAPYHQMGCSKEEVLRHLVEEKGLRGQELTVIGDGKVEIALGKQLGARTLGVASDEERGEGVSPEKMRRLRQAGADKIIGDFQDTGEILRWMGFRE